ncbi:MAG: RNA-binding protein [Kiritimatiellia bacterium]
MDIYVGNLAYDTTEDGLRGAFSQYGEVASARVVTDRMTGRSKGFGFVEMTSAEEGNAAIAALNGADLDGRAIRVNESQPKPREDRPRGGFGGGAPRSGGFGGGARGGAPRGGSGRGGYAPRESQW